MRWPVIVWLLLGLTLTASSRGMPGKPAKEERELVAQVRELAAFDWIQSRTIGYASVESREFAAFQRVVDRLTEPQAVALLADPRPVVRGYLAIYVAATFPERAEALYPLLRDTRQVKTMNGCGGRLLTVAQLAIGALRLRIEHAEVQRVLLRAAADRGLGPLRLRALRLVHDRRLVEAQAIAQDIMQEADSSQADLAKDLRIDKSDTSALVAGVGARTGGDAPRPQPIALPLTLPLASSVSQALHAADLFGR